MSLSILAVDRAHVTKVVSAATGTGFGNPFTKHPVSDTADLLVLAASGTFSAAVFDLQQSDDNEVSWQVAVSGWDAAANRTNQIQIAENVLYRLHCTSFTGTSVTVNASTTGEDVLLTQQFPANEVFASPDGATGFLKTRALVNADLPVFTESQTPNTLIAVARKVIGASDVVHLKNTPIEIVAAVTNRVLIPLSYHIQYVQGLTSTGYTIGGGDNLRFSYASDPTDYLATLPALGLLDTTATDDEFVFSVFTTQKNITETNAKSKGIVLFQTGPGEWSGGDGALIVVVRYAAEFVG